MFPLHTQLAKTSYYNDCKNHLLFLLHTEWPLETPWILHFTSTYRPRLRGDW